MAKTFYWIGGATGTNALSPYDWNNAKNWLIVSDQSTTTSSRFKVSSTPNLPNQIDTGVNREVGAGVSKTYCPGSTDTVFVGSPKYGQAKAPLLFGGCGTAATTSSPGWTSATITGGTGNSLGLSSLYIENTRIPCVNASEEDNCKSLPSYPFAWIGGGIENVADSGENGKTDWVVNNVILNNPTLTRESVLALLSTQSQDLRVIVQRSVSTNLTTAYLLQEETNQLGQYIGSYGGWGDPDYSTQVILAFKAQARTNNKCITKYSDKSIKANIGMFNANFNEVEILDVFDSVGTAGVLEELEADNIDNDQFYFATPGDRSISFFNSCVLGKVTATKYGGNLYFSDDSKADTVTLNGHMWWGYSTYSIITTNDNNDSITTKDFVRPQQSLEVYCSFTDTPTLLGYTGFGSTAKLIVTPVSWLNPDLYNKDNAGAISTTTTTETQELVGDSSSYTVNFNVRTPPTVKLGTFDMESENYQTATEIVVTGTNEITRQFPFQWVGDGRWHIAFVGSVNINTITGSSVVVKTVAQEFGGSDYPLVAVGSMILSNNCSVVLDDYNNTPVEEAGNQNGWRIGSLSNIWQGGLFFNTSDCEIYNGFGVRTITTNIVEGINTTTGSSTGYTGTASL